MSRPKREGIWPCVACGSLEKYSSGHCKPCQRKRSNAKYHENNPNAAYFPVVEKGCCRNCGANDRYPTGGCIPCAKVKAITNKNEIAALIDSNVTPP